MAERVTGILGGQPIQLDNAASEATLKLILDAINRSGSSSGAGANNSSTTRQEARDRANLQRNINQESQAHNDNTRHVRQSSGAIDDFNNVLAKVTKSISSSLTFLFNNAAPTFSGFSAAMDKIPVIGGILSTFGTILDSQTTAVRTATTVGVNFGDKITDVTSAAIRMGVSVNDLNALLLKSAPSLAALAGSASSGAEKLVDVVGALKEGDFANQMYRLGFTVQDLSNFTASYMEQEQKLGSGQKKTNAELTKGAKDYLEQLDGLARVTGLSREELDKQLKDQATDKMLQGLYQSVDGLKGNVQSTLAVIKSVNPEVEKGLKELIATGGVPISKFAQSLVLADQNLPNLVVKLRDGQISQEQFLESMRKGAAASRQNEAQAKVAAAAAAAGIWAGGAEGAQALQAFANVGAEQTKEMTKQAEERASANRNMLILDAKLQEIKNNFLGVFVNSGIVDKLGIVASTAITFLGDLINKIDADAFVSTINEITESIQSWNPMGFINDIKDFFSGADGKLATAVGTGLLALFAGGAVVSMVGSALSALVGKLGIGVGRGALGAGRGIGAGISGLGQGIGAGIGGVLSGIATGVKAFATPSALIGLTALTLAINGIAYAIQLAAPGIKPFGESVKTMLEGVSTVVDSVFNGISKVIEKFEPGFSELYNGIIKPVITNVVSAFNWVKDTVSDVFSGMMSIGSKVINYIGNGFKSLANVFTDFKDTISKMFEIVSPIFNTISKVASNIVESVSSFFKMSGEAAATVTAASPQVPAAQTTPPPAVSNQASEALVSAITKLNDTLKEKTPAADNSVDLKQIATILETVNNKLTALVQLQTEIAPVLKQTARNTRSSNMLG